MERPSKVKYYLDIAAAVATRSACIRRQYGAVIVKNDIIVSTGYNGSATTGKSSMSFVNEPVLYALILGSRKPEAKAFKRWITHEVLPSIRKHETYTTGNFLDDALHDPDMMIRMLRELKQEREKRLLAEEREQRTDDAIQDAFRKGFEWIYRPIIECNGKR